MPSARQGLLAIAGLCLAGIAAALVGQYAFEMRPCPWCILQRMIFFAIALVALIGAAGRAGATHRMAALGVVVLALLGSAAALYQHFVASKSVSCSLTLADRIITALRADTLSPKLFEVTASCADAAVSVLGVPFEIWSLALYLLLAAVALATTVRRPAGTRVA